MTDQNKTMCEGHSVLVTCFLQCYIIVSYIFICIAKFDGVQTITPILTFIVFAFNFPILFPLQGFYVTEGLIWFWCFYKSFIALGGELIWEI